MRGRKVREHLEGRELPGEIKVVLGVAGAIGVLGLVNIIAAFLMPGSLKGMAVAVNLTLALTMGTVFLGLLPRTRWGWWYATLLFAALFSLFLAAVVLSVLGSLSMLGRGCGILVYAAFTVVAGTPLWLLQRCRRRYFQLARRGPVDNR